MNAIENEEAVSRLVEESFEAESFEYGETVARDYADFSDHFCFFLLLPEITTMKKIAENFFDIMATNRLEKLFEST